MNLFKENEIFSSEYNRERRLKYNTFVLGILMIIIAYTNFSGKDYELIKNIFDAKPKEQIFVYLKEVQPLENRFYSLVNENIDLNRKRLYDNKKDGALIKESIGALDSIMIDLANVETNGYMLENKYLFLEELEIMRDILLEKKFDIENNYVKGFVKANAYLEKYFLIGQIRRQTLKKVFDKYYITYLELDNKIKYITK